MSSIKHCTACATNQNQPKRLGSIKHFLPSIFVSIGLALSILTALAGTIYFWNRDSLALAPAARFSLLPGLLLISFGVLAAWRFKSRLNLREDGFAWGLVALIFSDWLLRRYNFFQGPLIRGEFFLVTATCFFAMGVSFKKYLRYFAVICASILMCSFFAESGGRLLFSDDNPTFLYRLWLLKEQFPNIPFYNPFWNAGLDQRDFFATGSLNVYFLASPLLALLTPISAYNIIVAAILFLLLPIAVYTGARIIGYRNLAASFSAALSITASLLWYRWALKYGTLGFSVSAALVPLNLCLATRIICSPKTLSWPLTLLSFISFSLMLMWSPSGLVFVPIILMAIILLFRLLRYPKILSLAVCLLLVHLPWMTLFWSVSKVSTFVKVERKSYNSMAMKEELISSDARIEAEKDTDISARNVLKAIRQASVSTNPLLFFFALPALLRLRKIRKLIWLTELAWLLGLGSLGALLWPQIEFDRMLVILSLCLCIPAGRSLERLLNRAIATKSYIVKLPAACAFSIFILGPFSGSAILRNKSLDTYYFAGNSVQKLATLLKDNVGTGRGLFSGFVLHQFNHGHLAPLALLSGKPLVASSPFHNQWMHKDMFPQTVTSGGDLAIQDFLNVYNATVVIAHEEQWIDYFTSRSDLFELIGSAYPFKLFKRLNYASNYFLSGEGKILEQNLSEVTFTADTAEVTLKFNYFPFLRSSACEMEGQEYLPDITLIHLKKCPLGQPISIKSVSPWLRLRGSR